MGAHVSGIILSHNHPSGNLHPSEPDKQITSKIKEVCKVLDLRLLYHILLTEESDYSFTDEGLI
ncbi:MULTISPECIES: JAB domain-containing protein [unclassified Butyricimonas]|uniref:JAB domain-containing protein n=1 Tax=unclassified Butyricimonas TaxID=2637652 RepID=UPI001E65B2B4|nr:MULTISPECIES: JAB domain-containing protein [unclassified Butyricimonas]